MIRREPHDALNLNGDHGGGEGVINVFARPRRRDGDLSRIVALKIDCLDDYYALDPPKTTKVQTFITMEKMKTRLRRGNK